MHFFSSLIFLALVGSLAAQYARVKGRDPFRWFVIGMLFSLLGLLVLFLLPDLSKKKQAEQESDSTSSSEEELLDVHPVEWSKDWFYVDVNKKSVGPVSMPVLIDLWKAEKIRLSTLVWSEGMTGWEKIEDLRSLMTCLEKN
ncbi:MULTISPECIES: DUF4339 domain-containing protein [Parachlamydia]|uniref:GYF domain-containing protein n=2 Tax=Parachlamydia acanthamoebae TaxID=83552 RepID=F8KWZ8_PARAV|nr:DUF4339 domain-containing protein [Parachlamydia acanthamoebae]EFB42662.1 hypothetical protein pah_c004o201 [Parachlamydia acanthamoebae str. Hall's coccus]KIA77448.1 hypothetical protein DB43_GG00270 [Parachlamydia acanthamoebae]CCB86864.1 putative uncharacterized protein [Parachlamydia acanthamoebae UV-7]